MICHKYCIKHPLYEPILLHVSTWYNYSLDPSSSVFCHFSALQFSLSRLRGIKLPRVTVEALLGNLGLSLDDNHTLPSTLEKVCSIWREREANLFIDDLIQALVVTRTTGRYAALVCSTKGEVVCARVCMCVRYMYV